MLKLHATYIPSRDLLMPRRKHSLASCDICEESMRYLEKADLIKQVQAHKRGLRGHKILCNLDVVRFATVHHLVCTASRNDNNLSLQWHTILIS